MINGLTTPHSIEMYRMTVIHKAINFYIQHGKRINRMYTPRNMVNAVSQKTGKQYKASKQGMIEAWYDLSHWLVDNRTLNNEEIPL